MWDTAKVDQAHPGSSTNSSSGTGAGSEFDANVFTLGVDPPLPDPFAHIARAAAVTAPITMSGNDPTVASCCSHFPRVQPERAAARREEHFAIRSELPVSDCGSTSLTAGSTCISRPRVRRLSPSRSPRRSFGQSSPSPRASVPTNVSTPGTSSPRRRRPAMWCARSPTLSMPLLLSSWRRR
jgi:hypothetical protein